MPKKKPTVSVEYVPTGGPAIKKTVEIRTGMTVEDAVREAGFDPAMLDLSTVSPIAPTAPATAGMQVRASERPASS